MNIAGVLVHTRPEHSEHIRRALGAMSGVEIHAHRDDGRLVVTVEDTADTEPGDTLIRIHNLAGVLSTALVYQHSEPDAATEGAGA